MPNVSESVRAHLSNATAEPEMVSRFDVERAVLASDLAPLSRYVLMVLATWAHAETGRIPFAHRKSISEICEASGLARSTVCKCLDDLAEKGWLHRNPPTRAAARGGAKTGYALAIPVSMRGYRAVESAHGRPAPGSQDELELDPPSSSHGIAPSSPDELKIYQPNNTTNTNSRVRPRASKRSYRQAFEAWYTDYPRKVGKLSAAKAFDKVANDGTAIEDLVLGLKRMLEAIESGALERKYIPHPATWLNAGRWDDEYEIPEVDPYEGFVSVGTFR